MWSNFYKRQLSNNKAIWFDSHTSSVALVRAQYKNKQFVFLVTQNFLTKTPVVLKVINGDHFGWSHAAPKNASLTNEQFLLPTWPEQGKSLNLMSFDAIKHCKVCTLLYFARPNVQHGRQSGHQADVRVWNLRLNVGCKDALTPTANIMQLERGMLSADMSASRSQKNTRILNRRFPQNGHGGCAHLAHGFSTKFQFLYNWSVLSDRMHLNFCMFGRDSVFNKAFGHADGNMEYCAGCEAFARLDLK